MTEHQNTYVPRYYELIEIYWLRILKYNGSQKTNKETSVNTNSEDHLTIADHTWSRVHHEGATFFTCHNQLLARENETEQNIYLPVKTGQKILYSSN